MYFVNRQCRKIMFFLKNFPILLISGIDILWEIIIINDDKTINQNRTVMVRLIDIAREANVTVPVVSTVLNERYGKKGTIRVSGSLRARILEIADRLGYTPNIMARVLRGKASGLIGVMLDSGDMEIRFRQLDAFEKYCAAMNYNLLITGAHNNPERFLKNCHMLLQHRVDGILCHRNVFHEELRNNPKVVVFGAEPLSGMTSLVYRIDTAYEAAARLFAREKRLRTALLISDMETYDSIPARRHAFQACFGKAAPVFTVACQDENYSLPSKSKIQKLLKCVFLPQKIDSVIVQNDLWALLLCEQARIAGIRIPQQLSVVGQDNSAFTVCSEPEISTIDPNLTEFGKAAFDLLLKRINAPETPPETVEVDTILIERGTTMPFGSAAKEHDSGFYER